MSSRSEALIDQVSDDARDTGEPAVAPMLLIVAPTSDVGRQAGGGSCGPRDAVRAWIRRARDFRDRFGCRHGATSLTGHVVVSAGALATAPETMILTNLTSRSARTAKQGGHP